MAAYSGRGHCVGNVPFTDFHILTSEASAYTGPAVVMCCMMSSISPSPFLSATSEPSAHAAGATRSVVLCADDFAESAPISEGIAELAHAGCLSATSAMTLSPRWRQDAALLHPLRTRFDVGLHLDWTSPFALQAGHGLSLGRAMAHAALGRFRGADVRDVIARQLDAFEDVWQAPPDHIDGHQHIHQFAGIRQTLLDTIVRRYPLAQRPYLRLSRAPQGQATLKSRIIALWGAAALAQEARQADIPCAPALSGIYDFQADEATYAACMDQWLRAAPAGLLIMCHPAKVALPADPIGPARVVEQRYLASPRFTQTLQAQGIALSRGRPLYAHAPCA